MFKVTDTFNGEFHYLGDKVTDTAEKRYLLPILNLVAATCFDEWKK